MVDYLFDFLPELGKCCYCFPLKCGSIVIAILTMFLCGGVVVPKIMEPCGGNGGLALKIADKFVFLLYLACFIVAFSCIVFLVGICWDRESTARFYFYSLLSLLVIYLIYTALHIVGAFKANCGMIIHLVVFLVATIVGAYFLIVVRSFGYLKMHG